MQGSRLTWYATWCFAFTSINSNYLLVFIFKFSTIIISIHYKTLKIYQKIEQKKNTFQQYIYAITAKNSFEATSKNNLNIPTEIKPESETERGEISWSHLPSVHTSILQSHFLSAQRLKESYKSRAKLTLSLAFVCSK